jgi:hypothetical protein
MKYLIEEDPFLCPECAKVGYCIEEQRKRPIATEEDKSFLEEFIKSEIEIREKELIEQE